MSDPCTSIFSQTTLHNCEPHFVRCLVPNTHKKPGEVESCQFILIILIFRTAHIITIIAIITIITIFTILITVFLGGAPPHHAPADLQRCARGHQDLHAWVPQQVIRSCRYYCSEDKNISGRNFLNFSFLSRRMLYPDFKLRYACLGQKEIVS